MILKFKIKREELSRINDVQKDNTKYYKCKFYLDEKTWGNSEIFAAFKNNDGHLKIIPLGKYATVLSCTLPKNMIYSQYFKLYIYSKNYLKTNTISVFLSQKCDTNVNRTAAIDKILSEIKTKIDNIDFIDNQLKCYSGDTLIDTIYIDNVDEAIVNNQIQLHFDKLPTKVDDIVLSDDNIIFYGDSKIINTISLHDTSLSEVAWSGQYNDLKNIPNDFNPSQHTHETADITDYEHNVDMDLNTLLDFLSDEINKE